MRSTSPCVSSGEMSLIFFAGMPAKMDPDGTWVPAVTTAPAAIHDNGAHPYQYTVMKGTAMHDGIVANTDIIANSGRKLLIGAMDHRIVLHIYAVAQMNEMDIPANHGIEPNRTRFPHDHFAYHGGGGC